MKSPSRGFLKTNYNRLGAPLPHLTKSSQAVPCPKGRWAQSTWLAPWCHQEWTQWTLESEKHVKIAGEKTGNLKNSYKFDFKKHQKGFKDTTKWGIVHCHDWFWSAEACVCVRVMVSCHISSVSWTVRMLTGFRPRMTELWNPWWDWPMRGITQ